MESKGNVIGYDFILEEIKGTTIAALRDNGIVVSCIETKPRTVHGIDFIELGLTYTDPAYRGKRLATSLFKELKKRVNGPFIEYDGQQSDDGIKFLDSLKKSGENMYWLELFTKEKLPYEIGVHKIGNTHVRHSMIKTNWRLVIE